MTSIDRAARWLRVSTLKQEERNQEPDVDAWIEAHGYELANCGPDGNGTYRLKASASKGKQQKMLDLVIEDMREGRLDVLIVWKSNRIERRGAWSAFDLARKVRDAGGRIEYVKDAYLNDANDMSDVMLALAATKDKKYSEDLSQAIRAGQDQVRENYGVLTCLPWGYKAIGPKHKTVASPSITCRVFWPHVLRWCVEGDSCRTIAARLDSYGVKPVRGGKWNEDSLRRYIHNPVYCGRRYGWHNAPLLESEAVVGVDLWKAADDALSNRPKQGPRTGKKNPVRPMLAKLICLRCDGHMTRIHVDQRHPTKFNYRCNGRGANRKGCGNIVPYHETETIVAGQIFIISTDPHQEREWVEGRNWDNEITDIRLQLRDLDPESDEDEAKRVILKKQLRDYRHLNETEATTGGWQKHDTDISEGQYFLNLTPAERREYLEAFDIRVEKVTGPEGQAGIHVVIDGEDRGTWTWSYDYPDKPSMVKSA